MPDSFLFFAEHDFQVEDLLRRHEGGDWIALGPYAQHALKQRKIAYLTPEDFLEKGAMSVLSRGVHERLRRLCDRLDGRWGETHPALKTAGVRPFLFHIFPLTLLFDGLESRILQMKAVLRAHPGRVIRLHRTPFDQASLFEYGFSNRESLWGHLAGLPGWEASFNFIPSPLRETGRPSTLKSAIRSAFGSSVRTQSVLQALREKRAGEIPGLVNSRGKPSLLALGNRVEWREAWPLLRGDGWRLFTASEEALTGNGKAETDADFADFLENDPETRSAFRNGGIDFFPLLKERFLRIGAHAASDYQKAVDRLRVWKERGLKGVLTSSAATGRHHIALKAAQNLSLPVLLWQHGFVVHDRRINQLYDYSDRMTSDVTLVYGEGARESYERYGESFPSRLATVGSAQIERLSPSENGEPRRILYATTNYFLNYWYFGMEPGWSDNRFYVDQTALLEALERLRASAEAEITVKLHPSLDFPEPPWAASLRGRPGWTIVSRENTFTELARASGTVLLDCPSTTLLQAMALGRSVFALTAHWAYHPNVLALAKRRAVCEDSVEALMSRVSEYLASGRYPADRGDTEFLKRYGSPNERPASAANALAVLKKEIPR